MGLHEGGYDKEFIAGKGYRMKSARILVAVFAVLLATSCTASTIKEKDSVAIQSDPNLKKLVLEVPTITCTGCWPRVEARARSVAGVIDVKFDSKIVQRVTVVYDPGKTNSTAIIAAIEKNGDKAIELSE